MRSRWSWANFLQAPTGRGVSERMIDETLGYCPSCGAIGGVPFAQRGALRLMRCSNCSLVYLDPQPRQAVQDRYLTKYDLAEHFQAWEQRKRVLFEGRLDRLSTPVPGANRICDVGCADGQFMLLARERGWACSGIELNPPAARRARERGFEVIEGDVAAMSRLPWGQFDLVTAWDSLEHVPDAARFAEQLVRLTKREGVIMVSTLNIESLAFRIFRTGWSMVQEDHFTYWSDPSLRHLFRSAGCVVIEQSSFGLGRDFVTGLDRGEQALRSVRRLLGRGAKRQSTRTEGARSWDVNVGVLRAEWLLNRLLSATNSGVDVTCVARRVTVGSPA